MGSMDAKFAAKNIQFSATMSSFTGIQDLMRSTCLAIV